MNQLTDMPNFKKITQIELVLFAVKYSLVVIKQRHNLAGYDLKGIFCIYETEYNTIRLLFFDCFLIRYHTLLVIGSEPHTFSMRQI